jgi:hypothetical protein
MNFKKRGRREYRKTGVIMGGSSVSGRAERTGAIIELIRLSFEEEVELEDCDDERGASVDEEADSGNLNEEVLGLLEPMILSFRTRGEAKAVGGSAVVTCDDDEEVTTEGVSTEDPVTRLTSRIHTAMEGFVKSTWLGK